MDMGGGRGEIGCKYEVAHNVGAREVAEGRPHWGQWVVNRTHVRIHAGANGIARGRLRGGRQWETVAEEKGLVILGGYGAESRTRSAGHRPQTDAQGRTALWWWLFGNSERVWLRVL